MLIATISFLIGFIYGVAFLIMIAYWTPEEKYLSILMFILFGWLIGIVSIYDEFIQIKENKNG